MPAWSGNRVGRGIGEIRLTRQTKRPEPVCRRVCPPLPRAGRASRRAGKGNACSYCLPVRTAANEKGRTDSCAEAKTLVRQNKLRRWGDLKPGDSGFGAFPGGLCGNSFSAVCGCVPLSSLGNGCGWLLSPAADCCKRKGRDILQFRKSKMPVRQNEPRRENVETRERRLRRFPGHSFCEGHELCRAQGCAPGRTAEPPHNWGSACGFLRA